MAPTLSQRDEFKFALYSFDLNRNLINHSWTVCRLFEALNRWVFKQVVAASIIVAPPCGGAFNSLNFCNIATGSHCTFKNAVPLVTTQLRPPRISWRRALLNNLVFLVLSIRRINLLDRDIKGLQTIVPIFQ